MIINAEMNIVVSCIITIIVGSIIGVINAFLIIKIKIDSFITTLGMSSVLFALATAISNGRMIFGFDKTFKSHIKKYEKSQSSCSQIRSSRCNKTNNRL